MLSSIGRIDPISHISASTSSKGNRECGGDTFDSPKVDGPIKILSPSTEQWTSLNSSETEFTDYDGKDSILLKANIFGWYSVLLYIFYIVLHLAHTCSNFYLAFTYYKQDYFLWSICTVLLTILPALMVMVVSLTWYVGERQPSRSKMGWVLRVIFHFLLLSSIVRLTDALIYGVMSIRPGIDQLNFLKFGRLMTIERTKSCRLRRIECIMGSAPQLLLQLSIILSQPELANHRMLLMAQFLCCVTSWLSLVYNLTISYCEIHYPLFGNTQKIFQQVLYIMWKINVLASRILALALFAVVCSSRTAARGGFPVVFAACLIIHWLFSLVYLIYNDMHLGLTKKKAFTMIPVRIVFAAVLCFDVINFVVGTKLIHYIFFYPIIGIENVLACLSWYFFEKAEHKRKYGDDPLDEVKTIGGVELPLWLFVFIVCFTLLFGIAMMLAYLKFMHSSQSKLSKPNRTSQPQNISDTAEQLTELKGMLQFTNDEICGQSDTTDIVERQNPASKKNTHKEISRTYFYIS